MEVGAGIRRYELVEDWPAMPEGARLGCMEESEVRGLGHLVGQMVGEVRNDERLEIFVSVEQGNFQRILADDDRIVQIRLASDLGMFLEAADVEGDELADRNRHVRARAEVQAVRDSPALVEGLLCQQEIAMKRLDYVLPWADGVRTPQTNRLP